eukprot:7768189-Pyramimonas_sp.AAC.1
MKLKQNMEEDDPQRNVVGAGFSTAGVKLSKYLLEFVGKTAAARGPSGIAEFVTSSFLGQFTPAAEVASKSLQYIRISVETLWTGPNRNDIEQVRKDTISALESVLRLGR